MGMGICTPDWDNRAVSSSQHGMLGAGGHCRVPRSDVPRTCLSGMNASPLLPCIQTPALTGKQREEWNCAGGGVPPAVGSGPRDGGSMPCMHTESTWAGIDTHGTEAACHACTQQSTWAANKSTAAPTAAAAGMQTQHCLQGTARSRWCRAHGHVCAASSQPSPCTREMSCTLQHGAQHAVPCTHQHSANCISNPSAARAPAASLSALLSTPCRLGPAARRISPRSPELHQSVRNASRHRRRTRGPRRTEERGGTV